MSGIVFNNLLFTMTGRLIVIRRTDRKDLPHLTISLKNASGEVDLHLKDESAPKNTDPYTPLLKLSANDLNSLGNYLSENYEREFPKLYSNARRIRPGWLARNGYVLALTDNAVLTNYFYESAPRVRGKRRVDLEKLKMLFTDVDTSRLSLYHPAALHSNELRSLHDPVFAVRASGHKRIMGIYYAPWRKGHAWIFLNPLATALQKVFFDSLPINLKLTIKSVWNKVYDALQLQELGMER